MGQQQILLIVLSVILVGIAIAVGITMFQAQARQSNIDAMISDLNNLGSMAYAYRIRPSSMGGGANTYTGFDTYFADLSPGLRANNNATYTCVAPDDIGAGGADMRIKAVSVQDTDIIRWVLIDADGGMEISSGTDGPDVAI